jgi:LAO/AO transport system kinase
VNALPDPDTLAQAVRSGERRALARAITLAESTRPDHRILAEHVLEALLPDSGGSIRLGISGVPGVGKSSFIEVLGGHIIGLGHRVAVLAVDPSSPRSGGSILGDKTRMETLAQDERAFIRPSPSGGTLGGVARRTREALLMCEAAGFGVVIVETVGVGQSEMAVADMVDMFILLLAPGTGDELQGIKKGIVEIADAIIVNKADGDLAPAAQRARQDYQNALHLLRPVTPNWSPPVLACSSLELRGFDEAWATILRYRDAMGPLIDDRRRAQAGAWMWSEIAENLLQQFKADTNVRALLAKLEQDVLSGTLPPTKAARALLQTFLGDHTRNG